MQLDVNKYIGVPFVDKGRDPETGLDCWGLIVAVLNDMGITIPDYNISCFDSTKIGDTARSDMEKYLVQANPEQGAIVLMSTDPDAPKSINHFGVCLDKWQFIHTSSRTGVLITKRNDRFWQYRIRGYYRWNK